MTGPTIIEKAKQFHSDMDLLDNECIFSYMQEHLKFGTESIG